MADELQIACDIDYKSATDGSGLNIRVQEPKGRLKVTVSTALAAQGVQTIGTTHEAIDVGDVSTAGYAFFKNLDATNFVELGIDSGGTFHAFGKLKPGEWGGPFRLATNAPYGQADTSAVNLYKLIFAD